MTYKGIDLSAVITGLMTIVTALIGWVAVFVKRKQEAATAESKATQAWLKLAEVVTAIAGKGWDRLGPELQTALADGKIDAAERTKIEEVAKALLDEVTDAGTLEVLAKAVGLPVPGIVAWIASKLIDLWTQAHDPDIPTVSSKAYPVVQPGDIQGG
jgi:hypothetical protein